MSQQDPTYTNYELEVLNYVENENPQTVSDFAERMQKYKKAVQEKYNKRRSISIRPLEHDIRIIKTKAMEEGIPYQTLINSVIHKYASGRLIDKNL